MYRVGDTITQYIQYRPAYCGQYGGGHCEPYNHASGVIAQLHYQWEAPACKRLYHDRNTGKTITQQEMDNIINNQ